MKDAGADIVSGSQAHQPQGMEIRGDGFINYGLGNLFFGQASGQAVFLIPVLILAMFIVENTILWVLLAVTVGIYFAIIFLVFLYYGNIGKK